MAFLRRGRTKASADGDALLERAANGDSVAIGMVTGYRSEGATDDDIRGWWNLGREERVAVLETDETARLALYIQMQDEGSDADDAAVEVFRFHPRYGDPTDESHSGGDDRPLPVVLKDRVNRYIMSRMQDGLAMKGELETSTSFNAHVRAAIRAGRL